MRIPGAWQQGYVLDYHTIRSVYVGDDEFGHPRYETTRTEMGELVYRLKYNSDRSVLDEIIEAAAGFIKGRKIDFDLVVPVPPSRQRTFQPVIEIAKGLSLNLSLALCDDCMIKLKETPELKNVYDYDERLKLLEGAYTADKSKLKGQNILLFDDLYRPGATLNAMTAAAYTKGEAANVYVLALTRTRRTS
jgi:predicted amidophosphoribosyltransferase